MGFLNEGYQSKPMFFVWPGGREEIITSVSEERIVTDEGITM